LVAPGEHETGNRNGRFPKHPLSIILNGWKVKTLVAREGQEWPWFFDNSKVCRGSGGFTDTAAGVTSTVSASVYVQVAPVLIDGDYDLTAAAGLTFTQEIAQFYANDNAAATAADFTATITWGDSSSTSGAVTLNADGSFPSPAAMAMPRPAVITSP